MSPPEAEAPQSYNELTLWREYDVDYGSEKILIKMEDISAVEKHPQNNQVCRIYLKGGEFFRVKEAYDTVKLHMTWAGWKMP